MLYMPDCLQATWSLMMAPREALTQTTYNVSAMSFTPHELAAAIQAFVPRFEVRQRWSNRYDFPCFVFVQFVVKHRRPTTSLLGAPVWVMRLESDHVRNQGILVRFGQRSARVKFLTLTNFLKM